jgi:hypothetical protein
MSKQCRTALGMGTLFCICFFVQLIAEAKQSSARASKIVIRHPDKTGELPARWKWALAEGKAKAVARILDRLSPSSVR